MAGNFKNCKLVPEISIKFMIRFFLFSISWFWVASLVHAQNTEALNESFLKVFNAGNYKEALPIALKSVEQSAKEFGKDDINYAVCCQNAGVTYNKLGQWVSSTPFLHEAIRAYIAATKTSELIEVNLCKNIIATNHMNSGDYDSARAYYVEAYNYFLQFPSDQYESLVAVGQNLCALSFTMGNYDDIIVITGTLDSLVAATEGVNSENYYLLLLNNAGAYRQKPAFTTALEVYKTAEPICLALYGNEHIEYAELLQLQADCLRNLGRMDECEGLLKKSGIIFRKSKEVEPLSKANYHHNLGNYFSEVAQFTLAFNHYDTALQVLDNATLSDALLYGQILKSKTYTCLDAAMYPEALSDLTITEQWYDKQYKGNNPFRAELLVSKANIQFFTNQLNAASANISAAADLLSDAGDSSSYLYSRCFEINALIEHGKGNSMEAINLCRKAITINDRVFGDSNIYTANNLSNLGIILQELGEYAKAEEVIRESFAIKWKLYKGTNHPQLAYSLANWAMVQVLQRRYKDADQLLAASVEILKINNMLGTNNGQSILNNVALLSQKLGDYSNAEKLYRQVMESVKQSEGGNESIYRIALANLSTMFLEQYQDDSAYLYAKRVIDASKQSNSIASSMYLKVSNNAFTALGRLGKFEEAREIAEHILPIIKNTMGDSSELMGLTLGNYASLELRAGNYQKAAILQQQSLVIHLHHYKLNLFALSERDQVTWWTSRSAIFQLFPAILSKLDEPDEQLVEQMINQQLQIKGFILNNAMGAIQEIRKIQNPKLQQFVDQWQYTKSLYLTDASRPLSERRYNLDSLQYLANTFEQTINSIAGNLLKGTHDILWEDVQKNLKENEAAVEYIRYPGIENNSFNDSMQYAAIVITKTGKPRVVHLGSEAAIRWCMSGGNDENREVNINKLYRTKIGNINRGMFTGDSLYKLIWKPLESILRGASIVHMAPEGLLHKVAFAALPLPGDSVLLDKTEVRQYASVRQVISEGDKQVNIDKAFIAGHADFDAGSPANASSPWTDLPGTANEISAIQKFFEAKGKKVKKVDMLGATESAVRSLGEPSPDIIHIATHGFFLPEPEKGPSVGQATQKDAAFLSEFTDPFLRSGIVLAGANKYWTGTRPENAGDDGILTAFELAQLNWDNTKVVTLSACETGLGEVQDGEGVFGLKRAIKLAGARYTIVSLWQVPDAETAELMSLFYDNLLGGSPVRAAFFKAQTAMRKKYKPFEWAAFVLSE